MSGWPLMVSVFGIIFVAELPDKTALAALVLATRHRALPVLLGTASALAIQSAVAVGAGEIVSLLPARPVHLGSGIIFISSAALMWLRKEEKESEPDGEKASPSFWRATWLAFAVVFIAEWGDLTQIATAALAARYRSPYVVFIGSTLALWSVSAIAVVVGHRAGKLLDPNLTNKVAAVVFALIGAALVVGVV